MLPLCARRHSAQWGCSSPPSGFYSLYFLVPKKDSGLWPILDLRLLNHGLVKRSLRRITLKQILSQICPGDWFMLLDLKDAYFHIQVASHHRWFLEIRFRGGGVSIQGSSVCTVPGSSHYYAMHGCGSLPSVTDGNSHSGPVRGSFNIAQDPPPQPLKLPRAQDQLCLEHTVTQPMSIVPGHSYRLQMTATVSVERVTTQLPSRKEPPIPSKLSRKWWALWQQLRQYFSWVCFACDPYSSGWSRGFHPRLGITDATALRWLGPVYQPRPVGGTSSG